MYSRVFFASLVMLLAFLAVSEGEIGVFFLIALLIGHIELCCLTRCSVLHLISCAHSAAVHPACIKSYQHMPLHFLTMCASKQE